MLKSILKVLGSFLLVAFIIFAGLFAWLMFTANEEAESATPFINQAIPKIASWEYEQLRPLLSPGAAEEFETERGQKVIKYFSRLGALESHEPPQFIKSNKGAYASEGKFNIVVFTVPAKFQAGDATITITLDKSGESYSIRHIHINSDAFLE